MSDLISRQDAKRIVSGDGKYFGRVGRNVLHEMWTDICSLPSADSQTGECRTCKRSSDYLWKNGENGTRCPIEEHYALPKDGYCHLYDPYKGGEEE